MKRFLFIPVVGLAIMLLASIAAASPPDSKNFVSPLRGDEEVPPRDTHARGVAIFHLDAGEGELSYKLVVANIENVFAAHIHCAAAGVVGDVGVTLFVGAAAASASHRVTIDENPREDGGAEWTDQLEHALHQP